jgi:hypothetical protein
MPTAPAGLAWRSHSMTCVKVPKLMTVTPGTSAASAAFSTATTTVRNPALAAAATVGSTLRNRYADCVPAAQVARSAEGL